MKAIQIILFVIYYFNTNAQSQNISYTENLKSIDNERIRIHNSYLKADTLTKDSIILRTQEYLINKLENEILPAWYGTKWSYEGMTRVPNSGSISCGYFITNVLSDLGFRIPRIKWAQSASEVFIIALTNDNVKRYRNKPVSEIESFVKTNGEGIYLIGLDIHVGFLVYSNNKINFIHSNYTWSNRKVLSQDLNSESPIKYSSYSIVGKLFSKKMIENWILGIEY